MPNKEKKEPITITIDQCGVANKEEFRRIRSAFLNIFQDVEEARMIAEKEKNKTLLIVQNLTDGLIVLDKDNYIELVNNPLLNILHQREENLTGKDFFNISSTRIDLSKLFAFIADEDRKIRKIFRKEICLADKVFYEVTVLPLIENEIENGNLIILRDNSKEKLIDQMKTEFVSVAAHQLRTPLSAIKWTLRMILDGDTGELNEEQREFLNKTYESNERMINLVNDLLNVTRIDEGRFIYKTEPMQLEDLIDEVVKNSETNIKLKDLKISWNLPSSLLPEVVIDKEKMKIAIENLVSNAIKYTKNHGIISISLEEIEKEILLKITDDGVGIPQDQQNRIFTKFFRGENVIRLETEGSGLGLYATKNIIESHQGKIWFESEENKGTTFFVVLPKKQAN